MSKEIGYGFFPGGDPRKFKPDEELCTEDEIKSWTVACAQWEIGNEVAVGSSCMVAGGIIVSASAPTSTSATSPRRAPQMNAKDEGQGTPAPWEPEDKWRMPSAGAFYEWVDGKEYHRTWREVLSRLNALQQQVTELEGKAARYEEALRAVADDWATPPHLAELIRVLLPASPSTDYPMWAGDYYQGDSDALREAMNQKDDSTAATEGGEGA